MPPRTITDVFDGTDWSLLMAQKERLIELLLHDIERFRTLDGLLSWVDAVQDAASAMGYKVYPEDE